MKKLWLIFKHEYTRHVLRKRFLMALLSVPLWILVVFIIGILSVVLLNDNTPVGFIDPSGIITQAAVPDEETNPIVPPVEFIPYATEGKARAALDSKTIQGYFVLDAAYPRVRDVKVVYLKEPDNRVTNQFRDLLRYNLLQGQPQELVGRVIEGPNVVMEAVDDGRSLSDNNWVQILIPFVASVFLLISVFTSSGYLMQAVVEEKENRTMEILATSVSPGQIMTGKVVALIMVGLTQVTIWSAVPVALVLFASAYVPFLQELGLDWKMGLVMVATVIPTFVLISALMATIGATVTESREGQQVSSLVTLPVMAPLMLLSLIMMNPSGPIPVALTFFPLTAALTLLLRMGFSTVPTWQIIASSGLLILSAIGSLWLAGRVFRLGMLRYGNRIGWREIAGLIFRRPRRAVVPQQVTQ